MRDKFRPRIQHTQTYGDDSLRSVHVLVASDKSGVATLEEQTVCVPCETEEVTAVNPGVASQVYKP